MAPARIETIIKELEAVEAKLQGPRATGPRRLELLRRQAMLVDRREAAVVEARRRTSPRR